MGKRKATNVNNVDENTPAENNDVLPEADDDDLPAAFTPAKDNEEFKKGDLLFAQFPRYPYWPAVFYRYMTKRKKKPQKAYVFFFDELSKLSDNTISKKKIIPTHVNKLKRFTCSERDELIKVGSEHKDFSNGMEQAEEYMRKRALGKITSFFEYVVEETQVSDEEDLTDEHRDKQPEILQDVAEKRIMKKCKIACKSLFKKSKRNTTLSTNIISWIKMNSRSLLNDITTGKIISERHQTFLNGKQRDKDKLRWYSGFGELNEASASEILDLLVSWFAEDFPRSKYNAISYVADVWLPEAYIHGLSQTKNILLQDAEIEYLK